MASNEIKDLFKRHSFITLIKMDDEIEFESINEKFDDSDPEADDDFEDLEDDDLFNPVLDDDNEDEDTNNNSELEEESLISEQ